MKTILIVAYFFPPIAASGSIRPVGFCRHLETFGWKPRILSTDPKCLYPPLGMDEGLCNLLPNNLHVDRVAHPNPLKGLLEIRNRIRHELRSRFFKSRAGSPSESVESMNGQYVSSIPTNGWRAWKECVLQSLFYFPDHQRFWFRPAVRQLSCIPRSNRPDVVLATGSPWTSLLVGHALAKAYRVPFIADFRDPLIDNPYQAELPRYLKKKSQRLESFICRSASRIITTTAELSSILIRRYPEKKGNVITITNGFEEDIFKKDITVHRDRDRGSEANTDKNTRLEIAHFGTVYGVRNPFHLLAASRELLKEKILNPHNFLLRFVGVWDVADTQCNELAEELEHIGIVSREPAMDHALCLTAMSLAKVLLVIQHSSPLQIPGKIYEYIATGRPILVIGGEGATWTLVKNNKFGRCCENTVSEIKSVLKGHVTGSSPIEPPQMDNRVPFLYRSLTYQLSTVLEEVTQGDRVQVSSYNTRKD